VKGRAKNARAHKIRFTWDAVRSDDVFIFRIGQDVYRWRGSQANSFEWNKSITICQEIIQKEQLGHGKIHVLESGDDWPKAITDALGPAPTSFKESGLDDEHNWFGSDSEEENVTETSTRTKSQQNRLLTNRHKTTPMAVSKTAKAKVPEALAKKRTRYAKLAAKNTEARSEQKTKNIQKRREIMKRARAYAAEYANAEKVMVNQKKAAKKHGNFFVPDAPRLALVIRIRGINQLSPKPKKILQLMRLRQIGNAVFVRLNKASIQMLRIADPFITWGYPSQTTIKNMIYKRGAGKINGQRIKLHDNAVVEKGLGHIGIDCIEDLIHEITTVGDNFKEANNWLYPIKLSCARGGYSKITNHFIEGGEFGNREKFINNLVKNMN